MKRSGTWNFHDAHRNLLLIMTETIERKESKKEKRDRKKEKKEKKDRKRKLEDESDNVNEDDEDKEEKEDSKTSDEPNAEEGTTNELEIDLSAQVPLSKKQQRLLKKGKLDLEKISKKHPAPRPANEEAEAKPARSEFGVWIGNLSYDTSKEDLVRFITAKTASFGEEGDHVPVEEKDITRVNLPKKENKIKGFAYVDLPSAKHVDSVVSLSESVLNGRKLLIKNSSSFEGRPEADSKKPLLKNPPLRILFVGNLSFDTTEDNLEEHFRHCGDIVRIRMATFEDTGKCKGFAFIDFKDESGPTAALKSKLAKKLINRPLRLEYGEDRSKRNPKRFAGEERPEREEREGSGAEPAERERDSREMTRTPQRERPARPPKRQYNDYEQPGKRVKSSIALATAQRASAAIVPSQGKKTTFD